MRSIVMIIQIVQILSALFLGFFLLREETAFLWNFCFILFFLVFIFLSQRYLKSKNRDSWLCNKLQHNDHRLHLLISSVSLFAISYIIYAFLPSSGINLISKDKYPNKTVNLHYSTFDIKPSTLDFDENAYFQKPVLFSCYFTVEKPINTLLFYASLGEAIWKIDGIEYARQINGVESRHLTIFKTVLPGIHRLDCTIPQLSQPFPFLSVSVSPGGANELQTLKGPFYRSTSFKNYRVISFLYSISLFLFVSGIYFLFPFINYSVLLLVGLTRKFPQTAYTLFIILGICSFLYFQYPFYENGKRLYEADEAAFGLMSEQLLQGQSPPLFHYGQNYQGTIEAFVLSALLPLFSSPAEGLHVLPQILYVLFLLITVFSFWRYGSPLLGCFTLILLGTGGLHLHWIFSKTWFGYAFSLFSGSLLCLIAFEAFRQKTIRPGIAILWGTIAGLCLYVLPLSVPFVLFTFLILLFIFYKDRSCYPGFILALVFLGLFLFPYLLTGALDFLLKGRHLAAPRVAGESKLWDRFLGECLPVLLGVRSPFNHLDAIATSIFSNFPIFCFLFVLIFYPFLSFRFFDNRSILYQPLFRWFFYGFLLFTILLVSYSLQGIWPWYAISLYYVLPILFYVFLAGLFRFSPGLSFVVFIFYFSSIISSARDFSPFYQQPSSLSIDGFPLTPAFDAVKNILHDHAIHHVLCDQGWDSSSDDSGRDWVGECLTFDSHLSIAGVDRLSRRVPYIANDTLQSRSVGYLFHENYIYNNKPLSGTENFVPLSIENLDRLFGSDFLGYQKIYSKPYILYLPPASMPAQDKHTWKLESTNPAFMNSAFDHNMSVRVYGKDAYWSTGDVLEQGSWIKVTFPDTREISKLVVFHGTKWKDHSEDGKVTLFDETGKDIFLGTMFYDHIARSSIVRLDKPMRVKQVRFLVYPSPQKNWWTAYEIWII